MARKRSSLNQTRGFLYSLARLIGDIQALFKGPKATAKRVGRRSVRRATGRMMRRMFK